MGRAYIARDAEQWSSFTPGPSLEQRLAELEVLYDSAPIGIFLCDRDCRFVRVNRHLAELHGIPPAQHVGKLVWDIVPKLRAVVEPAFRRVLDAGETISRLPVEGETATAPGIRRFWDASYAPIYNDRDEIVAISGIVDEVTERKLMEKEHSRADAQLRRLMDANVIGVATGTIDRFTEVNDACLTMIGYTREDFERSGLDWRAITPPEHLPNDLMALESLKQNGFCTAFEKEYLHKDGRRVPVLVGAALLDKDPLRWIAFIVNLSEQNAREKHNRELMQELLHRSKNLIAVVSAVSHILAQTSSSLQDFHARFVVRLQALGAIHETMLRNDWRGGAMLELALSQFEHCADMVNRRIFLEGEPVLLAAAACQYIGMALHELCTNALKYGALSGETGSVTLRWRRLPDRFALEWIESGGPTVAARPTRQGFGHKVTTEIIAGALRADISADFRPDGLRWSMTIPASYLLRSATAPELAPA